MGWLDRAVEAISPELALKREYNRKRLLAYRIATDQGLRASVKDRGAGNTITQRDASTVRNWGRHLSRNNPTVQAACRELALRTAHFQLVPMVKTAGGDLVPRINEQLAELWAEYRNKLEVSGALSYRQLRQALAHSYIRDGEVWLQSILGSARFGYSTDVPLALKALEADFVPLDLSQDNPLIVQGIETTRQGQIRAVHVYTTHPGDYSYPYNPRNETIRLPIDRMMWLLNTERLGQLRGVSFLAPSAEAAADTDEYLQSERIAQKFAAAIGLQIVRAPESRVPVLNDGGEREVEFKPGMVLDQLMPGERAEMLAQDRPGAQFGEYLKQQYRAVAAGVGVNYSAMSNDFDGSYSSQRQMLITAQAFYEHQQQIQIERIERPLWRSFVQALALAGRFPSGRFDESTVLDADLIPPPMLWIDPQREAAADVLAVQNGFESRHGVIRKRGGSITRIDQELAQDVIETAAQRDAA